MSNYKSLTKGDIANYAIFMSKFFFCHNAFKSSADAAKYVTASGKGPNIMSDKQFALYISHLKELWDKRNCL